MSESAAHPMTTAGDYIAQIREELFQLEGRLEQAKVNALWRRYDERRTELQEAMSRREVPAGASPLQSIFHRKRRPPWK